MPASFCYRTDRQSCDMHLAGTHTYTLTAHAHSCSILPPVNIDSAHPPQPDPTSLPSMSFKMAAPPLNIDTVIILAEYNCLTTFYLCRPADQQQSITPWSWEAHTFKHNTSLGHFSTSLGTHKAQVDRSISKPNKISGSVRDTSYQNVQALWTYTENGASPPFPDH